MAIREGQDRGVDRRPEKLLTLEEASRILGVPADDVEAFVRSGKLPAFRLGGTLLRLRFQDVENLRPSLGPAGGKKASKAQPLERMTPPLERVAQLKERNVMSPERMATSPDRVATSRERIRAPTSPWASPVGFPFPAASPSPSMRFWQRWVEFIAFNDFYIVALLLILTLLALIVAL